MYNNEDNDYMNNNSDNNSRNYENVEPDNNQSTGTTGYTTYSHNTGYNQNSAGGAGMNNGQNQYSNGSNNYGWCSESAGLDASLKPASVTIDEPASDKLLIASAIIDNDDVRNPAVSFVRNSTILHIIPTIPANIPYSSLTLGFFVSL